MVFNSLHEHGQLLSSGGWSTLQHLETLWHSIIDMTDKSNELRLIVAWGIVQLEYTKGTTYRYITSLNYYAYTPKGPPTAGIGI